MNIDDIERRIESLSQRGICIHGFRVSLESGQQECLDCHKVASEEELDAECVRLLGETR